MIAKILGGGSGKSWNLPPTPPRQRPVLSGFGLVAAKISVVLCLCVWLREDGTRYHKHREREGGFARGQVEHRSELHSGQRVLSVAIKLFYN